MIIITSFEIEFVRSGLKIPLAKTLVLKGGKQHC